MDNEQALDQKAIDDLLATATTELSGMDTTESKAIEAQESSATEQSAAPPATPKPMPIKLVGIASSSQNILEFFIKRKWLAIAVSFLLFIAGGAFLGYKMAIHTAAAQTPLEKITHQGITFEEKNFVTYAGYGAKEIVTAFLDAGMSVDAIRDTDGWSPLMSACFYKKPEIVKILLEKQASVNIKDIYGKTPLMQAVAMGDEAIVTMLLASGADPNIQDKSGRTALMEAYSRKHAAIAEILKSAGADPTISPPKAAVVSPNPKPIPTKEQPITGTSSIPEETRISIGKAGFLQIGMTVEDIQKKYPSLVLTQKYVDGEKKAIANIYLNGQGTPSLQVELSNGKLKIISTISIFDEGFSTDKKITAKSSVSDIRSQYPINDVKVINESLFLVVKSMKMLFELDLSNNLSADWINSGNPDSIPDDIRIKRIVLY